MKQTAHSGMIIVNAAPTNIPIPKTDIAFNLFPIGQYISIVHHQKVYLPDEADLNIKGNPPTTIDATNMHTHCTNNINNGMVSLCLLYQSEISDQ